MKQALRASNHVRRACVYLVLCLVAGVVACNNDKAGPTGPSVIGRAPVRTMDCNLGMLHCSLIMSGIDALLGSTESECQALGFSALDRFNAEGYGFRSGNQIYAANMYVTMQQDANSSSGWSEADPNTYVNGSTFAAGYSAAQMGGLIGHEEIHHDGLDGPGHNTGRASLAGSQCSGN